MCEGVWCVGEVEECFRRGKVCGGRRSAFWRRRYSLQLQPMSAKRSRAAALQSWWEGEVCRSGEGMWDSAGSGTVGWHV